MGSIYFQHILKACQKYIWNCFKICLNYFENILKRLLEAILKYVKLFLTCFELICSKYVELNFDIYSTNSKNIGIKHYFVSKKITKHIKYKRKDFCNTF